MAFLTGFSIAGLFAGKIGSYIKIGALVAALVGATWAVTKFVNYVNTAATNAALVEIQKQIIDENNTTIQLLELDQLTKEIILEERDKEIAELNLKLLGIGDGLDGDQDLPAAKSIIETIERLRKSRE